MSTSFYMPVEIICGAHCIVQHAAKFKELGKKALIVTYPSSAKNGSLADVLAALGQCGMDYVLFDQCKANPSWELVDAIGAAAKKSGCDLVVGIGGGSALDSAKAAAVLLVNDLRASDLYSAKYTAVAPLIAIPTTAGTGAEVTFNGVLTVEGGLQKKSFGDARNYPTLAFLDARYLAAMPPVLAKDTAVDALCHCVEGFLSATPTPIGGVFAREGMRLFAKNYQALLHERLDAQANEELLLASTYAGIVISQERTLAPHAMGYMLTCYRGLTHGKATGLLLAAYVQACAPNARVQELTDSLGLATAQQLSAYIGALLGDIPSFTLQELQDYAKQCTPPAAAKPNPFAIDEAVILDLFKKSLL